MVRGKKNSAKETIQKTELADEKANGTISFAESLYISTRKEIIRLRAEAKALQATAKAIEKDMWYGLV